ncbi:hypothetical protein RJ640_000535 [Escallonia rubra]|uniref:Alpha 1,4-glycosyltransferase domain-containing protein n=1 Tax=Escallonia rubra TaxID=112253 RepID=A0AA88QIA6_9ASTE|nr:hypothetical protein RJ640_000535 [Escallonia rubra]
MYANKLYFIAPATVTERAQQDVLFKRILNQSLTFHLWNSKTYALIPEPDSLAARLINHPCIHCSEDQAAVLMQCLKYAEEQVDKG